MTAAIIAARNGREVRLFDTNGFAGKKLNITGKGRCNITNDCPLDVFLENIPRNARFLYSAFNAFTPRDVMDFFAELGLEVKTERGRRVFPVSDNARDVTSALTRCLDSLGVKVEKARITGLIIKDGAVRGVRAGHDIACGGAIVAAGGLSYPLTGSTGGGYRLAEQAGHTVTSLRPSLVPLSAELKDGEGLQGLTLKNVEFSVFDGGKRIYSERGEMLFTHNGVSGPIILSASAHMDDREYRAEIDLKPALDVQTLDARILRDFAASPNKTLENVMPALLPRAMIPAVLSAAGVSGETRVNSVTRGQRDGIVRALKGLELRVTGLGSIDEAVVTRGGVSVKEVDPKTMGSKLVKGLYFAGEVLDVDGYTGGFNLQIAWMTGKAAGCSV